MGIQKRILVSHGPWGVQKGNLQKLPTKVWWDIKDNNTTQIISILIFQQKNNSNYINVEVKNNTWTVFKKVPHQKVRQKFNIFLDASFLTRHIAFAWMISNLLMEGGGPFTRNRKRKWLSTQNHEIDISSQNHKNDIIKPQEVYLLPDPN